MVQAQDVTLGLGAIHVVFNGWTIHDVFFACILRYMVFMNAALQCKADFLMEPECPGRLELLFDMVPVRGIRTIR